MLSNVVGQPVDARGEMRKIRPDAPHLLVKDGDLAIQRIDSMHHFTDVVTRRFDGAVNVPDLVENMNEQVVGHERDRRAPSLPDG